MVARRPRRAATLIRAIFSSGWSTASRAGRSTTQTSGVNHGSITTTPLGWRWWGDACERGNEARGSLRVADGAKQARDRVKPSAEVEARHVRLVQLRAGKTVARDCEQPVIQVESLDLVPALELLLPV